MTHKKWHTPIKMEVYPKKLLHSYHFISLGSCFADNLHNFYLNSKINGLVNPLGISFNPISIAKHINMALNDTKQTKVSLGNRNGLYFHDDFHSRFNNINPATCLKNINAGIASLKQSLLTSKVLVLSLGSAIVHVKKKNNSIVTNCHKQSSELFNRTFLSVEKIVNELHAALNQIQKINPSIQVILTVSPIRHAKEGFVENNQSKATLLLACKELCASHPAIDYFPAYEIMLDELRDYRFFSEDMLHPNQTAINHILSLFTEHLFDQKSQTSIKEVQNLQKRIDHRLLHPASDESQQFNKKLLLDIQNLADRYAYLDFTKEKMMVEERLKI